MEKRYIPAFGRFVALAAMALASAAFAQGAETALVPFKVNVPATVTARQGSQAFSMEVAANTEKTLEIPLSGVSVSYLGGKRGQNAPRIAASRGNVTLKLPAQYDNAEIALYSVNGRRVLRGNAKASDAAKNVARRSIAAGTYLLSVKSADGGAFAARLTHGGGNLNVNAAFAAANASPDDRLGKSAAAGEWRINVSAQGYSDSAYTLPITGGQNALQTITLYELADVLSVTFNSGSAPVVEKPTGFDNSAIKITGEHVVIEIPRDPIEYNIVVSGTTANGSLKIYNQYTLVLHLNGANITNPKGPAINIQNPGTSAPRPVTVKIAGTNILADGAVYDTPPNGEQAKGAFFCERRATFSGGGTLQVSSKGNHAIVVDNDLTFDNANIVIPEAEKDGIHANDSINVIGGTFDIKSKGEAIQNERPGKAIVIAGAKITAATTDDKSHGISSDESNIVISGSSELKITVTGLGSKGIRSRGNMLISGGDIKVAASGDKHIDNAVTPKDTSHAAGIKVEGNMVVTGGKLDLSAEKANGNGKGINVNGNLTISGGEITAKSDGDGIKVDKDLNITGGSTYARSASKRDVDVTGTTNIANPSMLDAPNRR